MAGLNHYRAFEMTALVFCQDTAFLGTMNRVLKGLGLKTDVTADFEDALALLEHKRIDAVVIDWQEVVDLGRFLESIRTSTINQDSICVAIARDLLDMNDAFSAGVQFLVHKPASFAQISRCFEAMQGAILKQRRKGHREPVRIAATLKVRNCPLSGARIINISNEGVGLLLNTRTCKVSTELTASTEVEFAFTLPETGHAVRGTGQVMWVDREGGAGLQFTYIPDMYKADLEQWVGERFQRAVARIRESLDAGCA